MRRGQVVGFMGSGLAILMVVSLHAQNFPRPGTGSAGTVERTPDTTGSTDTTLPNPDTGWVVLGGIGRDTSGGWRLEGLESGVPGPILIYDRRRDSLYEVLYMPGEPWMWDTAVHVFGVIPQSWEKDPHVLGDVTGDGLVKTSDIVYLVNYVLRAGPPPIEPAPFRQQLRVVGEDPNDSGYVVGHLLLIRR